MTESRDPLEQLVGGVLRGQPPRRAPRTLEARVFAQLAGQARAGRLSGGDGWRLGFMHWPLVPRVAFFAVSIAVAWFALSGVMSVAAWFGSRGAAGVAAWHRGAEIVSATASLAGVIVNAIPPVWLYGAAVLGLALYALLFGLGTVAYRVLYVER